MTPARVSRDRHGQRAAPQLPLVKGSPEHRRYLRSPEWKAKRLEVFKRDGYTCRICGRGSYDTRKLNAHHLTYVRLGCERLEDLETACYRCHKRVSTW